MMRTAADRSRDQVTLIRLADEGFRTARTTTSLVDKEADDHTPRHVHLYRNSRFVLKWDLNHRRPISGSLSRGFLGLIRLVEFEGLL